MVLHSDLDQRSSRDGTLGAARLWPARRGALARARQFFRLRRDRALDEFEADLVLGRRLVLDQDDTNVTAAFELAEQHLVRERLLDVLLDHAGHRARAHLL